jgi:hypothetical protein
MNILKALVVVVALGFCTNSVPQTLPERAVQYLPDLKRVMVDIWPSMQSQSLIAAQIEQESCASLKSKKCWNPTTELKTPVEYGFGLGQLTIAYRKDGTVRFNNFEEMKARFPELRAWKWENRYDPSYQLKTVVLMDKGLYNSIKWPTTDIEHYAFMMSGYNGGLRGVIQDRTLCTAMPGCDPDKWFDNVEKYSFKTRIKQHGYGQSAFEINRGYVRNVFFIRRKKYISSFP